MSVWEGKSSIAVEMCSYFIGIEWDDPSAGEELKLPEDKPLSKLFNFSSDELDRLFLSDEFLKRTASLLDEKERSSAMRLRKSSIALRN